MCVCVFPLPLLQGSFLRGSVSRREEDPEAGGHQVHSQESVGRQREQHWEWDRSTTQVMPSEFSCHLTSSSAHTSSNNACTVWEYACMGSIVWVTKYMVSVETVGLCTGNVRSKEDRPIFSVPVARATAHRGGDGVEFPAAVYWRKRKRHGGWRSGERGVEGYDRQKKRGRTGRMELAQKPQSTHKTEESKRHRESWKNNQRETKKGFARSPKSHWSLSAAAA